MKGKTTKHFVFIPENSSNSAKDKTIWTHTYLKITHLSLMMSPLYIQNTKCYFEQKDNFIHCDCIKMLLPWNIDAFSRTNICNLPLTNNIQQSPNWQHVNCSLGITKLKTSWKRVQATDKRYKGNTKSIAHLSSDLSRSNAIPLKPQWDILWGVG